jgi:fido (protein-threonine AMPylation protein)
MGVIPNYDEGSLAIQPESLVLRRPPRGIGSESALSNSFWSWMLAQTWFVRFEGWESLIESPGTVTSDLVCAGENFLSQLNRLWGLDWHLDGLYPPSLMSEHDWRFWYSRFSEWIGPWFSDQNWSGWTAIEVERPSDVLWCLRIAEVHEIIVYCAHSFAFEIVSVLGLHALNIPLAATSHNENFEGILTINLTRHRRSEDLGKEITDALARNRLLVPRIQGWNQNWLENPRLPDRILFAMFPSLATQWKSVTEENRDTLRAIGSWMNSPSGQWLRNEDSRRLIATKRDRKPVPARMDLTSPDLVVLISDRLRALTVDTVPFIPQPNDWLFLHRHLFRSIYDFAGAFRKSDDVVVAGRTATVQASFIPFELELLATQFAEVWPLSIEPSHRIAVIAWAHLRFQRIHPFLDGNGHIGRLWLARQAATVGTTFDPLAGEASRTQYRKALTSTMLENNLAYVETFLGSFLNVQATMGPLPKRDTPLLQMTVTSIAPS